MTTLVIEAKFRAGEQPEQCDRLAELWDEDGPPTLLFLTLNGYPPITAITSAGSWKTLKWSDVAEILAEAVMPGTGLERAAQIDPGAFEYLRTLRIYGGNQA